MAETKRRGSVRGSIIVISAPSGTGKSTLVKRLLAAVPGLKFSVSYTTRPRRAGEKNGRDYFFVRPEKFRRLLAAGEFVEWADVFGHFYGTARQQLRAAQGAGKDILLDIDVQGHAQVRRRIPEAVSIFVLPPSYRELARRLRHRRSDAPEVIRRRLNNARREIRHWKEYDYLVVNDRLPEAVKALRAVVEAARCRRSVQQKRAREICRTFGG
ncbi:MAG: guanylate kinase [Terriglobia bacterium]